jgi:putative endopeptidase
MMAIKDLEKKLTLDGSDFLNHLGAKTDSIDVGQPAYYEKLNTLLKTIPMANWKLYLKANAIEGYATDLSKPLLMPLSIYQSTFWPSCAKITWRNYG